MAICHSVNDKMKTSLKELYFDLGWLSEPILYQYNKWIWHRFYKMYFVFKLNQFYGATVCLIILILLLQYSVDYYCANALPPPSEFAWKKVLRLV